MAKLVLVLACATLLVAGVVGCSSEEDQGTLADSGQISEQSDNSGTVPGVESTDTAVETPTRTPTPTPTPQTEFMVGDKIQTAAGNTLTVHSLEAPVPSDNQFFQPQSGNMFAVIDVEGCSNVDLAQLNPFDFDLQMADNTRWQPTVSVKDPALNATNVVKGDCVRGFVTFEIPAGQTPQSVNYSAYDDNFRPVVIKWTVAQ